MTTPAASRKDKYGHRSYAIPHPETRELLDLPSWSRLKGLMYSSGLETWKLKKVAAAVAKSTALQMEAADPATVYKAVEKALESDTEAADVGTYVHRYTEQVDTGTIDWDFVPPAGEPFIRAYEKLKAEWPWTVVEQEVTIFNLLIGYAGSADRFLWIPGLAEHLGLPRPELDVYAADIKTGKVWPEVALQLTAYSHGEHIFEAASKMDLGFTIREAQLEDDIKAGVGFDRINPGRRKWSDEAIKEAKGQLEAEWWEAYRAAGKFRPMPTGLRRDVGLVIHLRLVDTPEGEPTKALAEFVPVRLDGNAIANITPAMHVVDGLAALYKWGRRKDIIGEPIGPRALAPAAEPEPEPVKAEPVKCEACGELDDFHGEACPVATNTALDALHKSGLLDGAEVATGDLPATDEDKRPYVEWLADMAANRKHLLPALRASLDAAGLVKKLRSDTWTVGELRRWSHCAIAVERAAL